jgi:hypothetical protein
MRKLSQSGYKAFILTAILLNLVMTIAEHSVASTTQSVIRAMLFFVLSFELFRNDN